MSTVVEKVVCAYAGGILLLVAAHAHAATVVGEFDSEVHHPKR